MLRTRPLQCFLSQAFVRRATERITTSTQVINNSSQNVVANTFRRTFATAASSRTPQFTDAKDQRRKQLPKYASLQELEAETKRLVSLIQPPSEAPFSTSTDDDKGRSISSISYSPSGHVSMDQLYEVLEAWMEACLEGHGISAAQQGLFVLQAMEANFDSPTSWFYTPSTSFYDIVFSFLRILSGTAPAETVQNVLEHMLKRARKSLTYPQPTTKTFNIALNSWAKSHEYDAGLRAEELWQTMETWHNNNHHGQKKRNDKCAPNARTMAALVEAWGNSGHEDTPQRVRRILQERRPKDELAPDHNHTPPVPLINAVVFTNAIRAVTRHHHQGAALAEEILRLMQRERVEPNTRTYAAILHAYTSTKDSNQMIVTKGQAAQRATAILQQMIQKYRDGAADVKPNAYCFTTCITAWAHCREDDVELQPQEQAEQLWNELIQLYLETSDPAFRPSVETGNAVLTAWMRATHLEDTMDRGNDILERMRQFTEPDLRSYNILLNGLNWRGKGEEALTLLEWMEQQGPKLQPDRFSFNSVLAALAKDRALSNAQEKAEGLLRRMESSNVGADHFSYASVLDAWARSDDNDNKARRAEALVQVMMERFDSSESKIKPDQFILSNWIKACIPCKRNRFQDDKESRSSAFRAMELLKSNRYCKPNYVAYTNLLRVIIYTHSNNQEQQRNQLMMETLAECADGGHVSFGIADLLKSVNTSLPSPIPASWSRSVPLHDRPPVPNSP